MARKVALLTSSGRTAKLCTRSSTGLKVSAKEQKRLRQLSTIGTKGFSVHNTIKIAVEDVILCDKTLQESSVESSPIMFRNETERHRSPIMIIIIIGSDYEGASKGIAANFAALARRLSVCIPFRSLERRAAAKEPLKSLVCDRATDESAWLITCMSTLNISTASDNTQQCTKM
uniref:Uncharacterized protein n=1 Tax=Glossina pallidipes TaxID=7398 RepID=A0A1A9Z574_GLOPL